MSTTTQTKPFPTEIEHLILSTFLSAPPEMIAEYLRAGGTANVAPSDLSDRAVRALIRDAGAEKDVASVVGIKTREYRIERGWRLAHEWLREEKKDLYALVDQLVKELC